MMKTKEFFEKYQWVKKKSMKLTNTNEKAKIVATRSIELVNTISNFPHSAPI